jgi:SnoaL-like polyketide cyclase
MSLRHGASNSRDENEVIMNTETLNKAIVDRWFEEFWGQRYNPGITDELAAPDMILHYSMHSRQRGRQAVKHFMAGFREAFPNLTMRRIGGLLADRDLVVARWEGGGTHSGSAFNDFNIGPLPPASGCKIVLCGHTAVRFENGMIAEEAVWPTERKARLRPLTAGLLV